MEFTLALEFTFSSQLSSICIILIWINSTPASLPALLPSSAFFSSTHNMYQINSKCTNRNICSYFSRYKFHSGNQKKNRKVCQNQRCCVTPYIVIYSVLAMNSEISLRYLKHAAGILYFHPKQPESSSCAGIPAGTSVFGFLSLKYRIFGNSWVIEQNFEQPA